MSGYIGTQPVPQATQTRDVFTATSGQTTFATSGYTPNFLDVWLNGVKLVNGDDFTATNGSDVVLTSGAAAGDTVEVLSYSTFEVNSQTFTGTTTLTGDLQATTATFSGAVTGTSATLSGGVYLGGTGAANLLDDYEEGTFTPSILAYYGNNPVINYNRQSGSYTKVGDIVTVHIMIDITSASNLSSDLIMIGPLPFAIRSGDEADGISNTSSFSPVRGNHISSGCHSITQSYMGFLTSNSGSGWGWEATSIMSTSGSALRITMTYKTN